MIKNNKEREVLKRDMSVIACIDRFLKLIEDVKKAKANKDKVKSFSPLTEDEAAVAVGQSFFRSLS